MATHCEFCDEEGITITAQNTMTKELTYYCCKDCANASILLKEITEGIDYYNREISALTKLRDCIKGDPEDWKRILPFVYGWLLFYLALKRRDTRSRLQHLFEIALKKNQEVFSVIDGDTEFKEENPHVLLVLTKYLVKATQDKVVRLIDLFTTGSVTETI